MAVELSYGMQWTTEMTIATVVLTIVLMLFVTSQTNVSRTMNANQPSEYRQAIVLENMMSVQVSTTDLEGDYSNAEYYNRRGYLPIDFFNNGAGSRYGYSQNNGHCYIVDNSESEPLIPLLNGEDYAYIIEPLPGIQESESSYEVSDTDCSVSSMGGSNPNALPDKTIRSSARLKMPGDSVDLPVRLYVYKVSDN